MKVTNENESERGKLKWKWKWKLKRQIKVKNESESERGKWKWGEPVSSLPIHWHKQAWLPSNHLWPSPARQEFLLVITYFQEDPFKDRDAQPLFLIVSCDLIDWRTCCTRRRCGQEPVCQPAFKFNLNLILDPIKILRIQWVNLLFLFHFEFDFKSNSNLKEPVCQHAFKFN